MPLEKLCASEGVTIAADFCARVSGVQEGPQSARIARQCLRWNGTLVTTVFGLKSSAPLIRSAL